MDVKILFKMQDDVERFVMQDEYLNLKVANALEVVWAALRPLSKESSRLVLKETANRVEKNKADVQSKS